MHDETDRHQYSNLSWSGWKMRLTLSGELIVDVWVWIGCSSWSFLPVMSVSSAPPFTYTCLVCLDCIDELSTGFLLLTYTSITVPHTHRKPNRLRMELCRWQCSECSHQAHTILLFKYRIICTNVNTISNFKATIYCNNVYKKQQQQQQQNQKGNMPAP